MLRWLNSSDIFVYCSFLDAFPTVMLEAQSAGLPVVANDIGGIPETGKYVIISSSTPDDFARKIEPLIEDEQLRKKMGELNKKWIYEHDWDWAVNNYITVWRKL